MYIRAFLLLIFLFPFASNLVAGYFPNKENWIISTPDAEGINPNKIDKLMDLSFSDDATQAVVVIKNGKIISEKYADGYDLDSHGTSWSMAKSYYAALIGISLDRGEINSLDDKVSEYLEYFDDERSDITIWDLLDMSSGLDFPTHEHEKMFFQVDHLQYAKKVGVEKNAGEKFEYTSGTPLTTSSGFMEGTYEMQNDNGNTFDVQIPQFSLDTPFENNKLN